MPKLTDEQEKIVRYKMWDSMLEPHVAQAFRDYADTLDALKLELAESERISSGRLTTMDALYAETAKLKLERDAAEAATLEMAVKHYDELAEFSKTVPMFGWAEPFYRNIAKILRERITPGQSSVLAQVIAKARLEEYRWCVSRMDRNHDCGDGQCDLCGHRIELEAAAGRK